MDERETSTYEEEVDLLELLGVLLEHWALILASAILAGAIGFFVSKVLITPQYRATVDLIVNSRQDISGSLTNDNITSSRNLVSTYAIILKSNTILEQVIYDLQLDYTYEELYSRVSVEAVDDTQVMRISVRDPSPQMAERITASISAIAPDAIVEAVEAGSCKVISRVSAGDKPVSPNVKRNTALAAVLGVVVAAVILVLRSLLQNYIKDDADVQKHLGLPVLGVIPEIEEVK